MNAETTKKVGRALEKAVTDQPLTPEDKRVIKAMMPDLQRIVSGYRALKWLGMAVIAAGAAIAAGREVFDIIWPSAK